MMTNKDDGCNDFLLAKTMEKHMASLSAVETKLVKKMILNKTYPFTRLSPTIMEYQVRSQLFKWSVGLMVISIIWIIGVRILNKFKVMSSIDKGGQLVMLDTESSLAPIIILLFSATGLLHFKKRQYVLHCKRKAFQFYIGGRLVIQSHFHNIYVQLRSIFAASGRPYVQIEINGYGIEPLVLSGYSDKLLLMRSLAKRIAFHLNLSYFDVLPISDRHVVRHRCLYRQVPVGTRYPHQRIRRNQLAPQGVID